MKASVINTTYRIHNDQTYVYLFGRLENGESFVAIKQRDPYFYIKTKDTKKAKKLENTTYEKTKLTNFKKEQVTKVIVKQPKDVPPLRRLFEDNNIPCYEADIRYAQRFLLDNKINATCNIEGDYETTDYIDRIYKDPDIKSTEADIELKTLAFDIETSPDTKELYCVSLYTKGYKKSSLKQTRNTKTQNPSKQKKTSLTPYKRK